MRYIIQVAEYEYEVYIGNDILVASNLSHEEAEYIVQNPNMEAITHDNCIASVE